MKTISYKNFPADFPVNTTAIMYLYLDTYKPSEWIWTVCIIVVSFMWIGNFIKASKQQPEDIFETKK